MFLNFDVPMPMLILPLGAVATHCALSIASRSATPGRTRLVQNQAYRRLRGSLAIQVSISIYDTASFAVSEALSAA